MKKGKEALHLGWRAYAIVLAFAFVITGVSYAADIGAKPQEGNRSAQEMTDGEIIDTVVDNFLKVAKVPRPSHHEEKISLFMMDWAAAHGLDPVRDSFNNVMFDVPATEGMEDLPLGALQGHMDMVVAIADNKAFDPLNDPITVIRDDEAGTLTADGTSLGTDDGIGLAIIMSVVEGKAPHGPLRMILTVDEEDGMDGAFHLSSGWLEDVVYLINIDNEWSAEVLVSTAAGDAVEISRQIEYLDAAKDTAIRVEISNLKGGHSGVEIDKGRPNGIIVLAGFLKTLNDKGVSFELSSFSGGTAGNAIPTGAKAVLAVDQDDVPTVERELAAYGDGLNKTYAGVEENILCTAAKADPVSGVVSETQKNDLIKYLTGVIDGVYTWSPDIEGMVESSSNLGVVRMDPESGQLEIKCHPRSSNADKQTEILAHQTSLAAECGFNSEEISVIHMADAWQFDPDSKLLELARQVYRQQNGEEIIVSTIHAGLECGSFKKLNPDLDMISIGPDLSDVHTIKETLYLGSVPRVWALLTGILAAYH